MTSFNLPLPLLLENRQQFVHRFPVKDVHVGGASSHRKCGGLRNGRRRSGGCSLRFECRAVTDSKLLLPPVELAGFSEASSYILVALLASGLVVYLSKIVSSISGAAVSSDWILLPGSTSFYDFVYGRCPSLSILSAVDGFLEVSDVDGAKRKGGGGKMVMMRHSGSSKDQHVSYHRLCLHAADGGVISLDWPSQLDMMGALELDSALIIIPGTVQGSMAHDIQSTVAKALKSGYFPIVFNPRGCGGSPVTSPRLFTGADSDDLELAVEFVVCSRPESTIVGMGLGLGGNILAKYLAEQGVNSRVKAGICVGNPFDLDAATIFLSQREAEDRELTAGFVEVLDANKVLFQGSQDGFDLQRGLAATSLREFDAAISSVSLGFGSLKEFYSYASSGACLWRVQTPLLCIQADDAGAPLFTVPGQCFLDNPYLTLLRSAPLQAVDEEFPLVLDLVDGNGTATDLSMVHDFALEWLAAVEYALVKGRHPVHDDENGGETEGKRAFKKLLPDLTPTDQDFVDGVQDAKVLEGSSVGLQPWEEMLTPSKSKVLREDDDTREGDAGSKEAGLEMDGDPQAGAGKVEQAAEVVMQVLNVTMPGVLPEEKKKLVLAAVGNGETILNALQEAVPEDVRGKMLNAVSSAAQAGGISSQLVGFGKNFPPPAIPNVFVVTKLKEKLSGSSQGAVSDATQGSPKPEDMASGSEESNLGDGAVGLNADRKGDVKGFVEHEPEQSQCATPNDSLDDRREKPPEQQPEDEGGKQETVSTTTPGASDVKASTPSSSPAKDAPAVDFNSVLQIFTGFDDSTQIAVTSVFGVVESVLDKFEADDQVGKLQVDDQKPSDSNSGQQQDVEHENGLGAVCNTTEPAAEQGRSPLQQSSAKNAETTALQISRVEHDVLGSEVDNALLDTTRATTKMESAEQVQYVINADVTDGGDDDDAKEPNRMTDIQTSTMIGAVAATMGAIGRDRGTSLRNAQQEPVGSSQNEGDDSVEIPSIVTSLVDKATSVAAPVVPKKEDGGVDQEKIVAILTDLGHRGGALRFLGKAALLWGGFRGAMSLTDRILKFLRMWERPLNQRLVGFLGMALLLWAPVLVPLLPSLSQQWSSQSSAGVANFASVVGLYGAVIILVMIWGRRIRGYEQPLDGYGLKITSASKLTTVGIGGGLGVMLVAFLYSLEAALGYVEFSWSSFVVSGPSLFMVGLISGKLPSGFLTGWKLAKLVTQAVGVGFAVAFVEELLFRSWLQEEIAVDLGMKSAILLSAVAFAITHWSLPAMPGLFFLSIALAGARARQNGNLALSIGLHSGLISANYVLTVGGLVRYTAGTPNWLTGAHVANPLAGALGVAMVAALALVLSPRQ